VSGSLERLAKDHMAQNILSTEALRDNLTIPVCKGKFVSHKQLGLNDKEGPRASFLFIFYAHMGIWTPYW